MKHLPHPLRLAAAYFVIISILPAAFLVTVGELVWSRLGDFADWWRRGRWIDRGERLRNFVTELAGTAHRLVARWEGS